VGFRGAWHVTGITRLRVAILGNSGSGKSTLARSLAAERGAPTLDLDTIAWEPAQIAVPRDPAVARADLDRFCDTHPDWIVEGCYGGLVEHALKHGPELVLLDPGKEACLRNCQSRPWEPHKYASRAEQDERLAFLLQWVSDDYIRDGDMSLRAHEAIFAAYPGPRRRVTDPRDLRDLSTIP